MQLCSEGRSSQPFIIDSVHSNVTRQRLQIREGATCTSLRANQRLDINTATGGTMATPSIAHRFPQRIVPGVRSTDLGLSSPPLPLGPSAPLFKAHSGVYMWSDDVATSSTFPSPAVYIREPIWRYKTRRQEGGGPEPERREPRKPFYRAAGCWLI